MLKKNGLYCEYRDLLNSRDNFDRIIPLWIIRNIHWSVYRTFCVKIRKGLLN